MLIGTMNPEEGELRPQLMDRFALHVTVNEILDEKARVSVIKNNLALEKIPSNSLSLFRQAKRDKKKNIGSQRQPQRGFDSRYYL